MHFVFIIKDVLTWYLIGESKFMLKINYLNISYQNTQLLLLQQKTKNIDIVVSVCPTLISSPSKQKQQVPNCLCLDFFVVAKLPKIITKYNDPVKSTI